MTNSSLLCFPGDSEVKVSTSNVGDLGLIPGLGRSPGEGNGNPLQYSCLVGYNPRGRTESDTTEQLHSPRCIVAVDCMYFLAKYRIHLLLSQLFRAVPSELLKDCLPGCSPE